VSYTTKQLETARRILGGAVEATGQADDVLPYATDLLADNTTWPLDQCRELGDKVRAEITAARGPRIDPTPERRAHGRRAADRAMRATLEGALDALAAHKHGEGPSTELRTLLARVAGLEERVGAMEARPASPVPCCRFHAGGGALEASCGGDRPRPLSHPLPASP
jgi:hypothetical protein